MKINYLNSFIKTYDSNSLEEVQKLYDQRSGSKLLLDNTYGEYHFLIESCHSLNGTPQFTLCFSADKSFDELSLLIWKESSIWVLETNELIYLIDPLNGKIVNTSPKLTPIIGFYVIKNKLLISVSYTHLTLPTKA